MNLNDAEFLARTLIHKYAPHYRFGWMSAKRTNGRCNYREQTIYLSKPLTALRTAEAVRVTIMHEIAHAITPGRGHGPVWQTQMRKFGLPAERCSQDAVDTTSLANWRAVCRGCGKVTHMIRKPRVTRSCGTCSHGVFNQNYVLTYSRV